MPASKQKQEVFKVNHEEKDKCIMELATAKSERRAPEKRKPNSRKRNKLTHLRKMWQDRIGKKAVLHDTY
jgi:hypothetical protein